MSCLPKILSSSGKFCDVEVGSLKGVPIGGVLGDQQAATLGQLCVQPGFAKNTYGTGCFMLINTGTKAVQSKSGLLTTVLYKFGDEATVYALEGSVAVAGQSVKWLRDQLGLIESAAQISVEAAKVEDTGGMYFIPAFSGLFAPYWRDDARGTAVGMTLYTNKSHFCRAVLEAVCFQSLEILEAMKTDAGIDLTMMR